MIKVEKTKMHGKALLQMDDERLIAYYKGQIVVYKRELTVMRISLPMPKWKRYACKIRMLERAFHTDIRWAVNISSYEILFLFQSAIYKINLKTGSMEKDFSGFRGQPFSAVSIGERILMGDYGTNNAREPVNIFERREGTWRIVYTFPSGTIRHIHNIIPNNNRFYVLTGDEDSESGVWETNNEITCMEPLLLGKQQYRCCQLLVDKDKTGWFLTDAPSESNWLYRFSHEEVKPVCEIPGSVIYGTRYNDSLVFSTTIEPEAHAKNRLDYWLTTKAGTGIKGNEVKVYLLKDGNLQEIGSFEHDGMPLRLFQYASVFFSNIINGRGYMTATSVKHYDNVIMRFEFT